MKARTMIRLLVALALLATACGGGDDAGQADDDPTEAAAGADDAEDGAADGEPITVGAVFDLSGPTSDVGVPYSEGVEDYIAWLNGEGGIEGRPMQLQSQDYLYDVAVSEQLYSQFVSDGAVVFQGWGTADTEALRPRVTEDEVPFMSASLSELLTDPAETPYNFVVALTYSDQMRVALRHIADTDGSATVAVFHHDSPFGESPLADGEAYIAEEGLDIELRTVPMPSGATDYTAELTQVADVDYIIIQNVATPAVQLARDIATQGIEAQVLCLNWCANELFTELAGDAAEGALGVSPFTTPANAEGGLPEIEAFLEADGRTLEDIDSSYLQGWYTMAVMAAGVEAVVAAGEELTGPAIRAALEELEPIETPVSVPIDFTADSHKGMTSGIVYQVTDGAWTPVSDAITP